MQACVWYAHIPEFRRSEVLFDTFRRSDLVGIKEFTWHLTFKLDVGASRREYQLGTDQLPVGCIFLCRRREKVTGFGIWEEQFPSAPAVKIIYCTLNGFCVIRHAITFGTKIGNAEPAKSGCFLNLPFRCNTGNQYRCSNGYYGYQLLHTKSLLHKFTHSLK